MLPNQNWKVSLKIGLLSFVIVQVTLLKQDEQLQYIEEGRLHFFLPKYWPSDLFK